MGWTTETASTHDRCDSQSESHTEGCTTHLWLVQQVCSVLLHQFPHQVKVTTCCCHQDSCPAMLQTWRWKIYNQSMHLCHILHIPQYICQCRPDTSVASTAVLEFIRPVTSPPDTVGGLELGVHSHWSHHSGFSHSPGAFALPQHDHSGLPLKEQLNPTVQGREQHVCS